MRPSLKCHPETPCAAVGTIEVTVSRPRPGIVLIRYLVTGALTDLVIPPIASALRRDELWQHTCFEGFARAGESAGYVELNVSPSTEWAAYIFNDYRRDRRAAEIAAPRIAVDRAVHRLELRMEADLSPLPAFATAPAWRLGISAVIEERGGRKSYWALAHPPGKPDFHHSDCFALELQRA